MAALVAICVTFLLLNIVASRDFYISPSGSDSKNSGRSPAMPWKTSKNINNMQIEAGDSFLFECGVDHNPGVIVVSNKKFKPAVLFDSYCASGAKFTKPCGCHQAVLNFNSSLESAFNITNVSGLTVRNLEIRGAGDYSHEGVSLYSTGMSNPGNHYYRNIMLRNITISGFKHGIFIDAINCQGYADVTIRYVVVKNNTYAGISTRGPFSTTCLAHRNITIVDTIARDNLGSKAITDTFTGSGIVVSDVDNCLIERCTASGNGAENGHLGGGPVGIWAWHANNVSVRHCVSHHNRNGYPLGTLNGNDGGGFDIDGGVSNSVIEYCLSFENAGPGYMVCQFQGHVLPTMNNTIRYVVSVNDSLVSGSGTANKTSGNIVLYSPDDSVVSNTNIYGNTVFVGHLATVDTSAADGLYLATANNLVNTSFQNNVVINTLPPSDVVGSGYLLELQNSPNLTVSNNLLGDTNTNNNTTISTGTYMWNDIVYYSLDAFQQASSLPIGEYTTITFSNQQKFFQSCVPWEEDYPVIRNSPILDDIRGFSGCH